MITFDREPETYRHWRLAVEGRIATVTLDIDEDAGLAPGYKLKLNSYDLGVDIELHDLVQRIRFEHPTVACVILTSGKERMFCAGANIYMLGASTHGWKVNFCNLTNETRNGLDDSSRHDGLKFIAALSGVTAGGGYELALACDEIIMIDDGSTVVSLPEVPLLGVLPGTGGLTRLVDKRAVRRDLADLFCTSADGVKASRARQWGLIDHSATPNRFPAVIGARSAALAEASSRPTEAAGIRLTPLNRTTDVGGFHYGHVDVRLNRAERRAVITVSAPTEPQPADADAILAAGDAWWPLAIARELDDAILLLRTNEPELGLWALQTRGDPAAVLAAGQSLSVDCWLARETLGLLRRTFARLDVTSRSLYAVIDEGSCFAGLLFELALAADRSYMLNLLEGDGPTITLDPLNFGLLPTVGGRSRLETRFLGAPGHLAGLADLAGATLDAEQAFEQQLVTVIPDDLDWDDEIRLAMEERAALSPDALTGLEASLRFPGPETLETKIFSRLSAWQNWVFNRPNATGEQGALKLFGGGSKPKFNWERI